MAGRVQRNEASPCFASSEAHIAALLGRLDPLLHARVRQIRRLHHDGRALTSEFISDTHVDAITFKATGDPLWALAPLDPDIEETLDQFRVDAANQIDELVAASQRADVDLRMVELIARFGLDSIEQDIVVACLAPEIDSVYRRIYAYLHDDVTRNDVSHELLGQLFGPEARTALSRDGALRRTGIIEVNDLGYRSAQTIVLNPRVVEWLAGDSSLGASLASMIDVLCGSWRIEDLPDERALAEARKLFEHTGTLLCELVGAPGSGRQSAAASLALATGSDLFVIDARSACVLSAGELETFLQRVQCEATLGGAAVLWTNFDDVLDHELTRRVLFRSLRRWRGLVMTSCEHRSLEPGTHTVNVTAATRAQRQMLWQRALPPNTELIDVGLLASSFDLTPNLISRCVDIAQHEAGDGVNLSQDGLFEVCRQQSRRRLSAVARWVPTTRGLDDLVLPSRQTADLINLVSRVRHRALVLDEWGFSSAVASTGVSALFTGPPGTGKTLAAEAIATEIGTDLFAIDLSTMVSKYIGDTEKNLERLFREAERSTAVLFFDEADAIFGKRSEVKHAHDRFANQEISYLLQRVEAYNGVVLLASNLRANIDAAFVRRLDFIVDFPLPGQQERRRIWEQVWPDPTLLVDVDLASLAERYEISGGVIRNVAVGAAFLAAQHGDSITGEHITHSLRNELTKSGQLVDRLQGTRTH